MQCVASVCAKAERLRNWGRRLHVAKMFDNLVEVAGLVDGRAPRPMVARERFTMPELHATFYAAIVLVWYLERMARNSRTKKRRAYYCISPIPG
jgi:hypothetical protein